MGECNSVTGDVQSLINISGFPPEDEKHLCQLSQHLAPRIPALTDRFYERLLADERTRIHEEIETAAQTEGYTIGTCTRVLMHLLDICQYLIDSAYEAERMRRLTAATGMRPALLENLINLRN